MSGRENFRWGVIGDGKDMVNKTKGMRRGVMESGGGSGGCKKWKGLEESLTGRRK